MVNGNFLILGEGTIYGIRFSVMTPIISIITVTFNAEDVLERTLQSVTEQTFTNYEHIIVDGGSTDSTLDIASGFISAHLLIFSKKDTGIYHGMNRGLKLAKGDYIIFLNAGDTFKDKETLGKYAGMAANDYDIIYGDTEIVDKEGRFRRMRHLSAPKILTVDSFRKGMLVCHQAFMVRRSIAPKFSKDYKWSADYDWTIECMKATIPGRSFNLKQTVIRYLDDGMTEKHKWESLKERFLIMCRHYGVGSTLIHHVMFIGRALKRKITHGDNQN